MIQNNALFPVVEHVNEDVKEVGVLLLSEFEKAKITSSVVEDV